MAAAFLDRLTQAVPPRRSFTFTARDLDTVPAPVARYLTTAIPEGQPLIRVARLSQKGQFLLRPTPTGWRPFRAREVFTSNPPGFVWDARIRMAPGVSVFVRDAFVGGGGFMRASVLGMVTLLDVHGTPEIASGALHRYLAEAVWFPTALAPSGGVVWTAIDETTSRATLQHGDTTVSLDFRFGGDGLVESVYTPGRYRDVDGRGVPTPWEGRFGGYETRAGVRVPRTGEVAWLLPEGRQPYWRGEIDEVTFEESR